MTTLETRGIKAGTVQNTTSGTAIDFTGIPSWVKRITVIFSGVSTNGGASKQIQLGAGSVQTTGYSSTGVNINSTAPTTNTFTTGFGINSGGASDALSGQIVLTLQSGNTWAAAGMVSSGTITWWTSGVVTLSGTLDRLRLTTTNGTDAFDAGSVNILYEG